MIEVTNFDGGTEQVGYDNSCDPCGACTACCVFPSNTKSFAETSLEMKDEY